MRSLLQRPYGPPSRHHSETLRGTATPRHIAHARRGQRGPKKGCATIPHTRFCAPNITGHPSTSTRRSNKQPQSGQRNFSTSTTQQKMQQKMQHLLKHLPKSSLPTHTRATRHPTSSPHPTALQPLPHPKLAARHSPTAQFSAVTHLDTLRTTYPASSVQRHSSAPPRPVGTHRRRAQPPAKHHGQRSSGQRATSSNERRLRIAAAGAMELMHRTTPLFSAPRRLQSWGWHQSYKRRCRSLASIDLPMCRYAVFLLFRWLIILLPLFIALSM